MFALALLSQGECYGFRGLAAHRELHEAAGAGEGLLEELKGVIVGESLGSVGEGLQLPAMCLTFSSESFCLALQFVSKSSKDFSSWTKTSAVPPASILTF